VIPRSHLLLRANRAALHNIMSYAHCIHSGDRMKLTRILFYP
jgi:hypothetical protein